MNPSGLRIEEKKSSDTTSSSYQNNSNNHTNNDAKSQASYKSTHSTRSSVLERAREYNRRIDEQNRQRFSSSSLNEHRRAKSLERDALSRGADTASLASSVASSSHRRSVSAGRMMPRSRAAMTTRERAMASVRKDASNTMNKASSSSNRHATDAAGGGGGASVQISSSSTGDTHPLTPASTNYTSHTSGAAMGMGIQTRGRSPHPQQQHHREDQQQQQHHRQQQQSSYMPTTTSSNQTPVQQSTRSYSNDKRNIQSAPAKQRQNQQQQAPSSSSRHHQSSSSRNAQSAATNKHHHQHQQQPSSPGNRSMKTKNSKGSTAQQSSNNQQSQQEGGGGGAAQGNNAVVTPELLVDALSGHEDGLLAIAERLMEHYDSGYDVMGEAIIDAFADVQKLFQHVVEAAHMEGAAFEASRREEEMTELRKQAAMATAAGGGGGGAGVDDEALLALGGNDGAGGSPGSPNMARHDEFIDQDVKDALTEAIRKGTVLRDANQHSECLDVYERACQAASSLLPVDSDHRGRLQLSLARAESMSAERACAILRYSMDDVLRSGMRAVHTPLPDPSKRADVVLSRGRNNGFLAAAQHGVVQSSDEALASLMEEMKEILSAPVYNNTPLQSVSRRFWTALTEAQKGQQKKEQGLEQQLAKLKGDYLLAKAEWEEKLSQSKEATETYKEKYENLKESTKNDLFMEQSQSFSSQHNHDDHNDMSTMYGESVKSGHSGGHPPSVASLGSGLAQQAKTLVNTMNNFNCSGFNERNGSAMMSELHGSDGDADGDMPYDARSASARKHRTPTGGSSRNNRGRSASAGRTGKAGSRSFRQYSKSPQRVDL